MTLASDLGSEVSSATHHEVAGVTYGRQERVASAAAKRETRKRPGRRLGSSADNESRLHRSVLVSVVVVVVVCAHVYAVRLALLLYFLIRHLSQSRTLRRATGCCSTTPLATQCPSLQRPMQTTAEAEHDRNERAVGSCGRRRQWIGPQTGQWVGASGAGGGTPRALE